MDKFSETLVYGQRGEADIAEFFRRHGLQVENVSDKEEYQKKDVDLLVTDKNGRVLQVEVKTDRDSVRTGYIIVEEAMHRIQGTRLGWLYFCEADILCYYLQNASRIYFLDWPRVKALVLMGEGRRCKFTNPIDKNCTGEGRLLSIEDVLRPNGAILWEAVVQNF